MRKISLNGLFCPKSLVFKQILRTMKITLFLLLFVTFQAYSSSSYSQNAKISIPRSELRVSEILDKIEAQTEYLFVYNKKSVDVRRTVNVDADNQPVSEVLDEIFNGTDIRYVMEGKNIVLTKQNETATEAIAAVQQENKPVKGVVTDMQGEPIIGANVVEKGTTNGVITNIDGEFTLNAPADATLVISYIGYQPVSVALNGQETINVQMQEEALSLETVVVTAMGIKKKAASLTYSTQQVGGDELTRAKDPNMINALAGKTAGVSITRNSSGLGGSAKVSIRGIRSANESGNNQPLYVIDGVPMLNSTTEQAFSVMGGDNDAGNRDSGDGISNLNPDDIESMSILKGASAAALYGSQAANGVILITTKKGKEGMQRITFSSNLTIDKAMGFPDFQNTYAASGTSSWGEKQANMKDYNNVDHFFDNGVTAINSVTVQTGKEKMQTYFSYANTTAKGIINVNKLYKHNLTLRETATLFKDKLTLDANVNLISQTINNRPSSGGYYMNPLVGLYTFPRGKDMAEYRDNYEVFDEGRNMPLQNWYTSTQDFEQNPYWITNRITSKDKRYRAIASLSANLKVNDWLTLQARGNIDFINDKYQQKFYAGTASNLCHENGRYVDMNNQEFMMYGDVMAMFNKTWNNWAVNAAAGVSNNTTKTNMLKLDSGKAGLYYANVFSVPNMILNDGTAYIDETLNSRRVVQSVFATAQIGWKESLYLDLTARNDWSSTLANTSSKNSGFFYPSVGVSWIIDRTIKLPSWISFGKIRASWAQVGNDLPIGITSPSPQITAGGIVRQIQYDFSEDLKPEISSSWEIGAEWRFFNNRLDFDFTYYRTDTRNQLLYINTPTGNHPYKYINAGKIRNHGIELTIGGTPVMTENFRWKTNVNFSTNKNKVLSLGDNPEFDYGSGVSMPYRMRVKEGGSLGDIYGNDFARDENGKIIVTDTGAPKIETGNNTLIGNANPDCMLSWGNTFTYKGFNLYFLFDAAIGGDVISLTQSALDMRGVSKNSGEARDRGYVEVEGQRFEGEKIESFYTAVGNRGDGCTSYYRYDRTNIRLRELSLGYSFPQRLLEKTGIFKGIDLSLVARNLFFLYKDAPFDPDAILSVGNANQGVDIFGMPTTRNIGFNLKFTF
ncbi:TonB-dependent receptor [Bacteroides stercorirosoris]|uniref:TonB-dependent receptor n=1 Tax=Bacteroides stercorirosoris TaxID=871324 RepID=UPI00095AF529|nr:TonB-dependent receptor [Bacteroides stercorirosoris]OKZ11886.1 MAG: SusC/RagA family protein [Bacteroides oleiciplenus]